VLPLRRGRARRIRTCDSQGCHRTWPLRLIRVAQGRNRIAASTVSADRLHGNPLLTLAALPGTMVARQLLLVSAHVQVDQCGDPKYEECNKSECRLCWYGIPLPGLPPMQGPETKHCRWDCECPTSAQRLPPSADGSRSFRSLEVSSFLGAQRLVDQTNHVRDPKANQRCEEERHRSLARPLSKSCKQAAYHANGQPRSGRARRYIERSMVHKQRNDNKEGEDARNKHGH
jgi:hypothetical protein